MSLYNIARRVFGFDAQPANIISRGLRSFRRRSRHQGTPVTERPLGSGTKLPKPHSTIRITEHLHATQKNTRPDKPYRIPEMVQLIEKCAQSNEPVLAAAKTQNILKTSPAFPRTPTAFQRSPTVSFERSRLHYYTRESDKTGVIKSGGVFGKDPKDPVNKAYGMSRMIQIKNLIKAKNTKRTVEEKKDDKK